MRARAPSCCASAERDTTLNTNRLTGKGRHFAKRLYCMRMIGNSLGFFCIAAVLAQLHVGMAQWALLLFNGFIWPHLAYRFALRWDVPHRGERFNMMVDAALGGFWLIAMRFNLLPSALLLTMLSMNNIAAGGLRLFLRGVIAHALGALAGILMLGLSFAPQSTMPILFASLPFLVLHPLALGWLTYRLSQKLATHARELERLSQTDGLTGLWNRRHWEARLHEQFARCRDTGERCCLVLFDLDHFKQINDTEGHAAGDDALRGFALFLRANLRGQDVIGRYGGEEFGVIVPGLELAEAQLIVELLLDNLRSRAASDDQPLRCTASAGLAEYRESMDDFSAWLMEADRRLYAAKAQGRDCLVASSPELLGASPALLLE